MGKEENDGQVRSLPLSNAKDVSMDLFGTRRTKHGRTLEEVPVEVYRIECIQTDLIMILIVQCQSIRFVGIR